MRRIFFVLLALLMSNSGSMAQTSIEKLPAGNLISGWAVEAIPSRGQASRSERYRSSISEYAGQMGIARLSIDPNQFSSEQFERLSGVRQHLVFNGRGFLRIQAPQRYVFVATIFAASRGSTASCEMELRVGGSKVISNAFGGANDRIARRSQMHGDAAPGVPISGTTDLQPGFYPIEFIAGCPSSYQPAYMEIRFNIRGERDAVPRNFGKDELFHVQR